MVSLNSGWTAASAITSYLEKSIQQAVFAHIACSLVINFTLNFFGGCVLQTGICVLGKSKNHIAHFGS